MFRESGTDKSNGVTVCRPLTFQDSPDLLLLLRMLSLGQGAWDMIDSQIFKEPKLVLCPRVMLMAATPLHAYLGGS